MDLHPTLDHEEISRSAREYLAEQITPSRSPKPDSTALDPSQWNSLVNMGWFAMGLPEGDGGLGLSVVEEALVVREFGRQLVPPQALATMLAVHAALAVGDAGLAAGLAEGSRRAAFAVPMAPSQVGAPWTGAYRLVDCERADLTLMWSQHAVALAPLDAFGGRQQAPALDASLEVQTADSFDPARAQWKVEPDAGFLDRARILTAAALTGGAEAVRDISAEYAKTRHQFGKPIGSFQAIAHPCADMAVRSEAALACLYYAAVCLRDGRPETGLYSAAARSVAFNAAYANATASMQLHGGYGQTYEYLPHFYVKRAMIYGLIGDGVETDEGSVLAGEPLLG
ncbi:MAG: acyl-CoA/acyl-ACP dehydrogenase [Caulobacteraceae bacterium]|nr:acyl-CoA/acyl-ACP dehydrogenase [Caulobacteraceae bacterium]